MCYEDKDGMSALCLAQRTRNVNVNTHLYNSELIIAYKKDNV